MVAVKKEPKRTLADLVKSVCDTDNSDYDELADILVDEIWKHDATEEAVIAASRYLVRENARKKKPGAFNLITNADDLSGIRAVADIRLLDMRLSWANGVRLRNATRDIIENEAEKYSGLAEGNARKSRWMAAIASGMGPRQQVEGKYSETEIETLWVESA